MSYLSDHHGLLVLSKQNKTKQNSMCFEGSSVNTNSLLVVACQVKIMAHLARAKSSSGFFFCTKKRRGLFSTVQKTVERRFEKMARSEM
jgi:hypothetical protein